MIISFLFGGKQLFGPSPLIFAVHLNFHCLSQWYLLLIIFLSNIFHSITIQQNIRLTNKDDPKWNYWGPRGEHYWDKNFQHCKGRYQSPINIETERVVLVPNMQLSFINYDQKLHSMRLTNNGHGVMLHPTKNTENSHIESFVSGSALNYDIYRFLQLHFHWRNSHSGGSEHAIDGKKFTMEMHLVHQNVKYDVDESLFDRLLAGDLFLVLAVFFNESNHHNPALDPIIENLNRVINVHHSYTLERPIQLSSLLPTKQTEFFRYYGSYTTPDCQEIVTWIIFRGPLDIDSQQIDKYRQLLFNDTLRHGLTNYRKNTNHNGNGNGLSRSGSSRNYHDNNDKHLLGVKNEEMLGYYRHIQELGSRKIYAPMLSSSAIVSIKQQKHYYYLVTMQLFVMILHYVF